MNNAEVEMISIIVPVYNIEKYISKCLQSIAEQTYQNLEIIVVDDGSTDSSGKIADEFADKDSRFVIIHKENGGVASARNTGIANVHGDYIGFVDGDDYINREMFQVLFDNLKKFECDISGCSFRGVNDSNIGNPEEQIDKDNQRTLVINNYESYKYYYHEPCLEADTPFLTTSQRFLWNKIYKKNIFDDIFFPEDAYLGEDACVYFDIFKKASKSVYTDLKLYYYYNREDSLTKDKIESEEKHIKRLKINSEIARKYISALESLGYYDLYKECVVYETFGLLFNCSSSDSGKKVQRTYKKEIKSILDTKKFIHCLTLKQKCLVVLFWIAPSLYKRIVFNDKK